MFPEKAHRNAEQEIYTNGEGQHGATKNLKQKIQNSFMPMLLLR